MSYSRSYSSRPTISSYTATPYLDDDYYDDEVYTPTYYSSLYTPTASTVRIVPRVAYSRPSIRYNYDVDDDLDDIPYHVSRRFPVSGYTASPSVVYRPSPVRYSSPVRYIAPSTRIYTRELASPVRIVTSTSTLPAPRRAARPTSSVLSQELERLERKFQSIPLNDKYTTLDDDFLRPSSYLAKKSARLARVAAMPLPKESTKVSSYSRFDPDLVPDKLGDSIINNEFHVNRNILRPTRNTRDKIEILSKIKYGDQCKGYSGLSSRDFDLSDYTADRVRNDVTYLSYYTKNRDAVAANGQVNTRGGKRDKAFENDPLIVAKPAVISKNKLQTVEEKVTKNVTEELIETPASG